ncbi:MAG: hypothetical protein GY757_37635, partial [bacterium]|nr:hypothetical protein [bacterium]
MRFLPKFLFIIALLIQFATPGSIWGSPGGMVFYTDWTESPGHIYYYGSGSEWQLFDSPAGGIYAAAIGHGGSLHYSDANGTKIYRLLNGQPFEVYSHTTYVRDIGFDEQGSLYFSEASGAGGDGIIYSLKDGQSSIFCRVEISKVRGFWSGNFAFDPDGRLYISSGNTSGGTLYRMDKSTPIPVYDRHSTSEVIAGFDFDARGEVYYTDWGTTIYRLDLSTQTRTLYRQDAARSYANVWVSKGIITVGPEAGRVNRIAHHPTAGNIVYAGSSSGGVFRSNDSGASWTLRTAGITDGQIGGLSLYPPKPTVLIAASPSGIYRSENEGLTWTNVLSTPRTLPPNPLDGTIWEMQKSPVCYDAATRALYAAPQATGLYKSSDGGKTWKQVFGAGSTTRKDRCVLDILIAPEGGGTVYIATLDGIRKNVGGNGPLWPLYATEIKNASNTPLIPVTMRIAPSQKDLFYVTTFNMSPRDSSIWRRDTVTGKFKNRPMGKPSWYSWCPLWSLAVHPTEKYRIFMGAVYLHTSSSAGDLSMYFHKYSASTAGIGPDYRHLEIDPAGKSLYAALDHGILRYDFAAKKSSAIEKGLTNTQLYDLDVGPAGTVYIATQDTGAF